MDSPASHEVGQVVDQQFGQILVGRGVVGLADQNGRDLSPEQRYAEEVGHLLAPLARPLAQLEVEEVAASTRGRVQQRQPQKGSCDLAVAEQRQKSVADGQRALLAPLPVRVLVTEGRVDLVKVVAIRVPHVRAQNPIPPRLVQTVLQSCPRLIERDPKGERRRRRIRRGPSWKRRSILNSECRKVIEIRMIVVNKMGVGGEI